MATVTTFAATATTVGMFQGKYADKYADKYGAYGGPHTIVLHDPYTKDIAGRVQDVLCPLEPTGAVSSIMFDSFKDGMPKLNVVRQDRLRNRHVTVIVSMCDTAHMSSLLMVLSHLSDSCHVAGLTVVISAFMFGTDDRSDELGTVVTAHHAIKLLWKAVGHKTRIYMCEPHTLQLMHFSDRTIIPIDVMSHMLARASHGFPSSRVCIVMPDNGADKRYGRVVHHAGFARLVCNKSRLQNGEVSTMIVEDHRDPSEDRQHQVYIVIDDIIRSGSTMLEALRAVKKHVGDGPLLRIAAVHADFVDGSMRCLSSARNFIDKIYISDTNTMRTCMIEESDTLFEVVPCASAIAEALV